MKRVVVQDVRCPDGINVGQEQHGADPSDCLETAFAAPAKGILPRDCVVRKRPCAAFCGAGNDILQRGRKSETPIRARVCADVCAYPRFARAQSETYVLSVIGGRKIGSNIATLNAMEDLQNRAIRLQEDICLAFGTVGEVE